MPRRRTLLTALTGFPGTLKERDQKVPEEKPGYWSREMFEERFVRNSLLELSLLDEAPKILGHEPQTIADLWKVVKSDSARPVRQQMDDLNELLTEKINAATKFLGLMKPKGKKWGR